MPQTLLNMWILKIVELLYIISSRGIHIYRLDKTSLIAVQISFTNTHTPRTWKSPTGELLFYTRLLLPDSNKALM